MNRVSSFKTRSLAGVGLLVAVALYVASNVFVSGADTSNVKETKTASIDAVTAKPAEKSKIKKLTGSELYAINCNRCHQERYPTEFTSAQWKNIMLHMRVRANLPAAQAKLILKYLQEDAGN